MSAIKKHNIAKMQFIDEMNIPSLIEDTQLFKQLQRYCPNVNNGELYESAMFPLSDKKKLSAMGHKSFQVKSNGSLTTCYFLPDTIFDELKDFVIEKKTNTIKAIKAINIETNEVTIHKSISKAAVTLNCDKAAIAKCLKNEGYHKQVKGYRFEYADD